jgi:hypothetical protein
MVRGQRSEIRGANLAPVNVEDGFRLKVTLGFRSKKGEVCVGDVNNLEECWPTQKGKLALGCHHPLLQSDAPRFCFYWEWIAG